MLSRTWTLAALVAERDADRVHVKPRGRRRRGGTDLSGAVESSSSNGRFKGGRTTPGAETLKHTKTRRPGVSWIFTCVLGHLLSR